MVQPSQQAVAPREFHRYACIGCRSKKIKCDNVATGCSNCRRAGAPCHYVARRSRKPAHSQRPVTRSLRPAASLPPLDKEPALQSEGHASLLDFIKDPKEPERGFGSTASAEIDGFPDRRHAEHGDLYIVAGKSLYMDSRRAKQVTSLEAAVSSGVHSWGASSCDNGSTSSSTNTTNSSEHVAGRIDIRPNPRSYYPSDGLRLVLWNYYVHNFDPLVKIVFKPAIEGKMTSDFDNTGQSTKALLFAIWYAAVMTMTPEECLQIHQQERKAMLTRYRYALELALSQAGWMNTLELEILQALVILLVCSSGSNTRGIWMLSGICVSIAVAMGLHRDSSHFSLPAIDVETRRRVWWTLCIVDNRISDECGLEVHVPPTMDTALPAHLNDYDLHPGTEAHPRTRAEYTDMTIALLKIEMVRISLKMKMATYAKRPYRNSELEKLVRDTADRIETYYLGYLDRSIHIHNLCYLGAMLILTKLKHVADTALQELEQHSPQLIKDRLLIYNATLLDIAVRLPDEDVQFGWYFHCKHIQFHALAFLLEELPRLSECCSTEPIDRAWGVVDNILSLDERQTDCSLLASSRHYSLWQKLLTRARSLRSQITRHCSTDLPSMSLALDQGFDDYSTLLAEHEFSGTSQDVPLLDPFFGWASDMSTEMGWY